MEKLLVALLISSSAIASETCESIIESTNLSKQDISLRRSKEQNQILTFKQKISFLCNQISKKPSYEIIDGGIKLPDNYIVADSMVKEADGTIKLIKHNER